jgi:hypothetical protein
MVEKKGGGKQVLPNGRFGYPNGQDFPPNEMKGMVDRKFVSIQKLFYFRWECIFIALSEAFFLNPKGIICFYAKDKHIISSGFGQYLCYLL